MKPVRRLFHVFASFFEPDRAQRSTAFLSFWTYWLIIALIYSDTICEQKKKRIVHSQGASNINYSTVIFNFDICRLSYPVSSTNFA